MKCMMYEFFQGFMAEYGHHPYYVVVDPDTGNTHSVLLFNSNAMEYSTFTLPDGRPAVTLRTIGGILDFHIFTGPTLEDVNKQYAQMVGLPAFPPYWSLGFHLSRYGYASTNEVREVRERMKAMGIPQDVQTLDIDYMERFRDFTYDPVPWGDLPALTQELHNDNLKLTIILDPAVVIDWDNYPPGQRGKDADAFIKWYSDIYIPSDQDPTCRDYVIGYVWPDTKTVFPDFFKPSTKAWWKEELNIFYESVAYDAIWIDMNEPANFGTNLDKPFNWPSELPDWSLKCPYTHWDSPPYPTKFIRVGDNESGRLSDHGMCMTVNHTDGVKNFMHYDVHSLYGWSETDATFKALQEIFPGKRPVVLSRSTYPGSGKYAVHWLGDNTSAWSHLKMSVIGMLEFNLFGLPMVGADICGFFGDATMELCMRWMELGAFYPFSRNHNAIGQTEQDPGIWPEVAEVSRFVLNLRYQYLPYLYTLFHAAHMHGNSVVRPLFSEYPTDLTALDVDDQFMWGTGMMFAPVLTESTSSRNVYFPQGLWYHSVPGFLAATGPSTVLANAPMEAILIYVRGGAILPYQEPSLTTVESRQNPFGLTVALDESGSASGELFWDDGEEEHAMSETYFATMSFAANSLNLVVSNNPAPMTGLNLETVRFYGYPADPALVTVNGENLDPSQWAYDADYSVLSVTMSAPLDQDVAVVLS
ncbi:hypothetical protein Pcinc_018349 [Petrolisthes cinctipes]|uniref:Uncharacterized protein n=1 Tax=Petrolisthes cinctipes TaxID=88211 RepID=A0AAE1FSA2_PETCI|nr:hypothetical protein Pcinc_018349 [Petrolisthes cinctipes]